MAVIRQVPLLVIFVRQRVFLLTASSHSSSRVNPCWPHLCSHFRLSPSCICLLHNAMLLTLWPHQATEGWLKQTVEAIPSKCPVSADCTANEFPGDASLEATLKTTELSTESLFLLIAFSSWISTHCPGWVLCNLLSLFSVPNGDGGLFALLQWHFCSASLYLKCLVFLWVIWSSNS